MSFSGDLYPTAGATSVLTTKGDMVDYNTERQRLGIGSTGQVLTVASSLPTWTTLTTADSVLTTQGDVLYEGAGGLARLGQSTDGFVLTTKGAGANPVWATAGGGSLQLLDNQEVSVASSTITYTPASSLLSAEYSEIIVVLTFAPSDANADTFITLNNVTTGYHTDGSYIQSASETYIDLNNQGSATIGHDAEANRSNVALINIHMADSDYTGTKSAIMLVSAMSGGSVFFNAGLQMNTTTEEISEIEVSTSSGDYQVGSMMAVYGRKRT